MDIGAWLRGIGLSQYEAAFRENEVDAEVLPKLTAEDLRELGVAAIGHRRKLLDAIAGLSESPSPTIDSTVELPSPGGRAAPEASAERRYLTVMFCDLVGSTRIAATLDAEEWRDLVNAYLDAASAAVTGMGGHVAKKLGDGLMALFGYPTAQENDAERAARAALAIQSALGELNRRNAGAAKPTLAARIGLEAGSVVVDATGEIYGDAPNIAARVQALAEPGAVLVTARVQRQVAGLFVAEERGVHELKGVPGPQILFRLVRASGGGRRAAQRQLTPIVGRDEEIAVLMRRWERARQGDGQMAMIIGEPGLGKSRLIEELHARLSETPHTWVEWSSSQLLQNTPLHPIAEWGRQRFGGADVAAERRLADLENALTQVKLDPAETVPLLAPLLDIPLPTDRSLALAPEELRRRQLAALTGWVLAGAKVQPIVLAIEDLHWADPTTLDVLRGLAERGAQAPLFILATARPEFRAPWGMRSHHGAIALAPLDRGEVREMVADLAVRHALSGEVVDNVAARTGGVPLFIEEVTRLLMERGAQSAETIPPTLQQSLAARLDRLGAARKVAQIGSVIGRGFSYALLRATAGMEEPPLQAALERLAEADILLVQGLPPQSDYRFKHALIQDAAYENLLKSRRQILHRRVAEVLTGRFADTAAAEPEALAHHFTQAGLTDAAIEWWGKAGDQALRRSAFQEAISHLGKAIDLADKAGSGSTRRDVVTLPSERLKLQTSYGQAMMYLRGYASEESKSAFAHARELADEVDNVAERFAAYYGQWSGCFTRGETRMARNLAAAFLREAEGQESPADICAARRALGVSCLVMGDFADAQEHLIRALTERDAEARFRIMYDTAAVANATFALAAWCLGAIGRARESMDEALRRVAELDHVPTTGNANIYRGLVEMARGDAEATMNAAHVLARLGKEHAIPVALAFAELFSSWARAWLIDQKIGAIEYRSALENYLNQGNKVYAPFFKGLLAELEEAGEDLPSALTCIDEALALAQETEEHYSDVFLYRLRGEILLKRDPTDTAPAEESFRIAVAIAQQQSARSFGLRAALSLAKLYQSTGRAADASAVLAPALEGFSPTPEFPEIEEARVILLALKGE